MRTLIRTKNKRRGAVLVETLIAVPLFIFILFGLYDAHFYAQTSLAFTHIAREAVLAGSVYPFSAGTQTSQNIGADQEPAKCFPPSASCCPANPVQPGFDCRHRMILSRILELIQSYNLPLDPTTLEVTSSADASTPERTVAVTIKARYRSTTFLFSGKFVEAHLLASQVGT